MRPDHAALALVLAACSQPVGTAAPRGDRPAPERWSRIEQRIRAEFPGVRHVDTAGAERLLAGGGATVVDVRRADEFAVSHLPGAVHAPEDRIAALLADKPRDTPVIVYCSVGYRSARAARALGAAGFTNVHNYLGSIFAWANAGKPMVDATGPTRDAHPYDTDWGELLRGDLHRETPRR